MRAFPSFIQPDIMDCGPTSLRIIAKYFGRSISLDKLRKLTDTSRTGSSLQNISNAAEKIGFRTLGVKINLKKLREEAPLPCIIHWKQDHFVVIYKINKDFVYISDPAVGLIKYNIREFLDAWIGTHANEKTEEGISLLLELTHRLKQVEEDDVQKKQGFSFLYQYLFGYKRYLFQLAIGLLSISILQLIFPFLTQSIVDIGIQNKDITFSLFNSP
jgi:ATP-binding cassette, subfamily B, bacterial